MPVHPVWTTFRPSRGRAVVRWLMHAFVVMTIVLAPCAAHAHPRRSPPRTARARGVELREAKPRACLDAPVHVVSEIEPQPAGSGDSAIFSLARCDGTATPLAVAHLSVLARPGVVSKPRRSVESLSRTAGHDIAPGIHRLDPRLAERLELVVDHFRKPGATPRVVVVSGYRAIGASHYHARGRALDFRIDGIENTSLVGFCKTLADTGCGYYPNAPFIHMDIRDPGTGNVAWTDPSRSGEPARYLPNREPALPALPSDAAARASAEPNAIERDEAPHSI